MQFCPHMGQSCPLGGQSCPRPPSIHAGSSGALLSLYVVRIGGTISRPPQGGRIKGPASRPSPRVPPPPRAAPGVGHAAPPAPLGCAPCALSRTGPGYLSAIEKGRCGLSTPAGGGQHSRASIGRDPRFHGYFLKKAPQAGATGVCETLCVLHTEGVSFERG